MAIDWPGLENNSSQKRGQRWTTQSTHALPLGSKCARQKTNTRGKEHVPKSPMSIKLIDGSSRSPGCSEGIPSTADSNKRPFHLSPTIHVNDFAILARSCSEVTSTRTSQCSHAAKYDSGVLFSYGKVCRVHDRYRECNSSCKASHKKTRGEPRFPRCEPQGMDQFCPIPLYPKKNTLKSQLHQHTLWNVNRKSMVPRRCTHRCTSLADQQLPL